VDGFLCRISASHKFLARSSPRRLPARVLNANVNVLEPAQCKRVPHVVKRTPRNAQSTGGDSPGGPVSLLGGQLSGSSSSFFMRPRPKTIGELPAGERKLHRYLLQQNEAIRRSLIETIILDSTLPECIISPFAEDRATRDWGRESYMNPSFRSFFLRPAILLLFPFLLVSCKTSTKTPPPPTTFTIGGTVTNLAAASGGVTLQDNGQDNLTLTANGTFTFPTAIASGLAYAVTVHTQPSSPAQTCGVVNASGAANANVTNITVNCGHNEWAWMSGSNDPTTESRIL
jgi:hypothetical protein